MPRTVEPSRDRGNRVGPTATREPSRDRGNRVYYPLIPADLERCQMEVAQVGEFGRASDNRKGFRYRCFNRPEFIVIVKKADGDGKRPEMSLCDGCRKMFAKTNDIKKYNFRRIKR